MRIKECIVLAGGLGTRLRSAVPDLPKCMAPVAGKPFLEHVISYLQQEGIERFIFSLGYRHDVIESFLQAHHPRLNYAIALESEPLGTGGAIGLSCELAQSDDVLIVNGDTLFRVSVKEMSEFHAEKKSECTLALKPMTHFDRYGVVETDSHGRIRSFREKQFYEKGLINGGVYALNIPKFRSVGLTGKFSFEKDYLETNLNSNQLYGIIQDGYFIDIGIPEDFEKANKEL